MFLRHAGLRPVVVHGGGPQVTGAPGPARHRVGVHRRAAGHHRGDHRRGPDGAQRQGQQGHRRPHQPASARTPSACPARTRTCSPRGASTRPWTASRSTSAWSARSPASTPSMVRALLDDGRIPVISSVARGADGAVYNVNADTAAAALAVALGAAKLVVLTDVAGLYRDWPDSRRGDQPARRRRPGRAAALAVRGHDPEDGGLPDRGQRRRPAGPRARRPAQPRHPAGDLHRLRHRHHGAARLRRRSPDPGPGPAS